MTAQYANIRRADIERLVAWLGTRKGIIIKAGSKHYFSVMHVTWDRPFPILIRHSGANKFIMRKLMEQLVASGVCTKGEFDERIK